MKRRTRSSQRQCPMLALEQRDAKRFFQRLDLARQRRLRQEKFLRSERE